MWRCEMQTLTITELQARDPARFDREYYEWLSYAGDFEWAGHLITDFKEKMRELGLDVDSVDYDDNYGWSASVKGSMRFSVLMERLNLHEEYLPLYLDTLDVGHSVTFGASWRSSRQTVEIEETYAYCSAPQGVFSGMEQDDWQDLVEDQFNTEDWAQLAIDWIKTYTDKLASELEAEYEAVTSEEEFIASCEVNGVTFEVEGEEDEV
jgi:hypothetical protein